MAPFSPSQISIIQKCARLSKLHWYWQRLWLFIDSEAQSGAFKRYSSKLAHLDPDMAKEDAFGRFLLSLKASAQHQARKEYELFAKARTSAVAARIPIQVIDQIESHAGRSKWAKPSFEKLLTYLPKQSSVLDAKKQLRAAIRNADALVSQRELNILARYAEKLKPPSVEAYRPPKRIHSIQKRR